MLRLIKSFLFATEKHHSLYFVYFTNFCFCILFLCPNNWKARIATKSIKSRKKNLKFKN